MNNLTKVCNIWDNLDESFENMASKLKVSTRVDFIKKLVGYDEASNSTKIEYIKGKLNEEIASYSDVEMSLYTKIINVLTGVDLLIKSKDFDAIENAPTLNSILMDSIVEVKNVKETTTKLPEDFFQKLAPLKSPIAELEEYMTLDEVYNLTGCVGETFILNKDNTVSSYVLTNTENEIFIYNSMSDIISMLDKVSVPATRRFASYCIKCYKLLLSSNKLKNHTIMLSKKYYKVDGKKITVYIGNESFEIKLTPQKIISEDRVYGYLVKIKTGEFNTQLVLLDI